MQHAIVVVFMVSFAIVLRFPICAILSTQIAASVTVVVVSSLSVSSCLWRIACFCRDCYDYTFSHVSSGKSHVTVTVFMFVATAFFVEFPLENHMPSLSLLFRSRSDNRENSDNREDSDSPGGG